MPSALPQPGRGVAPSQTYERLRMSRISAQDYVNVSLPCYPGLMMQQPQLLEDSATFRTHFFIMDEDATLRCADCEIGYWNGARRACGK